MSKLYISILHVFMDACFTLSAAENCKWRDKWSWPYTCFNSLQNRLRLKGKQENKNPTMHNKVRRMNLNTYITIRCDGNIYEQFYVLNRHKGYAWTITIRKKVLLL